MPGETPSPSPVLPGSTSNVQLVVITGISGAGKSEAIRSFEDLGYFCVDNLPPALLNGFLQLLTETGTIRRAAVVCDIRGGLFFDHLYQALEELERNGYQYQVLFLEAADEILVHRYKETRRRHPLAREGGSILEGIREERRRLQTIRGRAQRIIDTSRLSPRELKEKIAAAFLSESDRREHEILINVVSFGFKHGIPLDCDLVFDVRFLPNPYYVDRLRPLTGLDAEVADYVFRWPVSRTFMEKLADLLTFLLPNYISEGKAQLVIGIGCTGGQHRSVAVAERLGEFLQGAGYQVRVEHRDCKLAISTNNGTGVD
ncbi:MAG: RNase adapter RapZ [Limnochordales bacterium]|nr:RNase adapter RapZ [Limnochordales bacterium]